ncbi:trafficking protein particle complex subunit 13-like [Uloborus diversus]|uniref:trafficking protein particle complex subunit 13-like n=1 Tax=Uloborus diversus TaxID=327109 RepID=UPI0024095E30|nr:trafficking protein particle complex subunit 13-like [Uloborus diversus]XP_054721600.1 trafficking protein particle complex subunit 13-like [Uloborus diversus]
MESREKEHLLALKVMRLTRPSLYATHPVASDSRNFPCNLLNSALKSDIGSPRKLEYFGSGNLLMLPQSFGNIYLGETFSCYMSVHNDSQQIVSNVNVQADLQIGMQKIVLAGHRGNYSTVAQLKPDESVDDVIHHEVKEIGTHILACTVSYTNINNEKMHFRKFFKFQVGKPLDVKTKFYNTATDEVFLEAPLQNITYAPMCLEKVALEPSSDFTAQQVNSLGDLEDTNQKCSVFGEVNCLNPLDSRQYLFCLTPKHESQVNLKFKGVTSIGKLDIVWRTSMGEKGRLQTSQLERMAPGYGEIRLIIKEIPSIVNIEKPFPVTIRISNTCDRTLDLVFSLHNKFSNGVLWQGVSGQKLNKLEKGTSVELHLEAVAVRSGIQLISGIKVKELFLKRIYDFDEIAPVFVSAVPTPIEVK